MIVERHDHFTQLVVKIEPVFLGETRLSKIHSGNISGRVRAARVQAEMEPAELRAKLKSRGIELSKTGLHRLETIEPTNPNLKAIEAISEITKVSPGWILFGKGPQIPITEVGDAIRSRVVDTIELMAGALDLTNRQQTTLEKWLDSVRTSRPKNSKRRN